MHVLGVISYEPPFVEGIVLRVDVAPSFHRARFQEFLLI